MKQPVTSVSPKNTNFSKLDKVQTPEKIEVSQEDSVTKVTENIDMSLNTEENIEFPNNLIKSEMEEQANSSETTLNGKSASLEIENMEENSNEDETIQTEEPLKLISISFPSSVGSYGPALKEILPHCVKVHKPKPIYIKFDSAAEAEQKQSVIENISIDGMKLQTKILKSTYDPLKRVTVISSKLNANMNQIVNQLGAISFDILKSSFYIQVYALTFRTEAEALAADKLTIVMHDYTIRLRPYRDQFNKRENETPSSNQSPPKKIKMEDAQENETPSSNPSPPKKIKMEDADTEEDKNNVEEETNNVEEDANNVEEDANNAEEDANNAEEDANNAEEDKSNTEEDKSNTEEGNIDAEADNTIEETNKE